MEEGGETGCDRPHPAKNLQLHDPEHIGRELAFEGHTRGEYGEIAFFGEAGLEDDLTDAGKYLALAIRWLQEAQAIYERLGAHGPLRAVLSDLVRLQMDSTADTETPVLCRIEVTRVVARDWERA